MSKKLLRIELHGSRRGKATGYQEWPGFGNLIFDDGTRQYLPSGSDNIVTGIKLARELGANVDEFVAALSAPVGYPPKPEGVTQYQHNYGYEVPLELGEWEWSTTFGRWSRLVKFADGWHGFSYPKP